MIDSVSKSILTLLYGVLNTHSTIRTKPSLQRPARVVKGRRKVLWNCAHKILSTDLKYLSFNIFLSSTRVKSLPIEMRAHRNTIMSAYSCSLNLVMCPCTLNQTSFVLLVQKDLNTSCQMSWVENCMSETSARNARNEFQKSSCCLSSKCFRTIFTYFKLLCCKM